MPDEKGLGSKILGVFFENEEDKSSPKSTEKHDSGSQGEKSAADIVAELAQSAGKGAPAGAAARSSASGVSRPPPLGAAPPQSNPAVPAANVDFDTVFKNAGMDSGELDRVRKAEELLRGLPEATPHDVKKQIVEASLKAFGFDIGKIAAAAQSQLKALDTYTKVNEQQTAKAITDAQNKISQIEEQIINLRVDIDKRTQNLSAVANAADVRRNQVQKVLEFFNAPALPPAPKA